MRCPKTHKAISGILDLSGEVVGRHTGKYIYQQEEWVLQEFLKCGLAQQNSINDGYGHSYKTWLEDGSDPDIINDDCFIKHPFGDCAPPDFVSKENSNLFWWECKSSVSGTIQCNTTPPAKGVCYVITLGKKTVVSLGERIVPDDYRETLISWISKVKLLEKEAPIGISCKPRLRPLFEISSTKRFVTGGYGDICSKEILNMLEGTEPIILPTRDIFQQGETLERFFA